MIMINNKGQVRVGSEWLDASQVDWGKFESIEHVYDFKVNFLCFDLVDEAMEYIKTQCTQPAKLPPIPMIHLSADELSIVKSLRFWEERLSKSTVQKFDWKAADMVTKYKYMLKTGKSLCTCCMGQSDRWSPCGKCGVGFSS